MTEPVQIPFRDLDELKDATIAGRFRLHEMIGRGGYGAVFVGEQTSVGRKCAVKVLVPHVLEQPRNVRRFEIEARATSQLVHPNTIVIYDFGLDEERRLLYLAMEFIDGDSLRQRIHVKRRLDVETAVWIAHQAAGSLQDAHDRGLVHRDVKPHNIMLTTRGGDHDFVKVIDFGIAKFLDDASIRETFERVTQTGTIIGTPAYMSPEQVRNQELDGRTDQYALAVCVYQMLTGETIFQGDSPVDIATKQLMERPRPVSELNPDVPEALDRVLLKALEKDRERRYDTIREFAAALADAADLSLHAVDSAERRREAAAAVATVSVQLRTSADASAQPTAPMALPDAEPQPTTEPMGAGDEAEPATATLSAALQPLPVPEPDTGAPRLIPLQAAPHESEADGTTLPLVLIIGVIAMIFVAAAWFVAKDDAAEVVKDAPVEVAAPRAPDSTRRTPSIASAPEPLVATETAVAERETPSFGTPDLGSSVDVVVAREAEPQPVDAPRAANDAKPPREIAPPVDEPPARASGSVTVTVVPWGVVVIDGKKRGEARKQTVDLEPGRHEVELRQGGRVVARKTVDVQPGKNTMVKLIAAP